MSSYCIIVESGTKCAKIMSYLGSAYNCIASNGHIRILKDLGDISLKDRHINFSIDPDKAAHIKKMKTVLSNYPKSNIILGTDHDREGEAIAWHLCQVFDLPVATTKRIVFHEITKPALKHAVANPRTIDMNLVYAQHARQALDMIVGFKISPLLWHLQSGNKKASLSAGRCQTPALRLIYEQQQQSNESMCIKHHVVAGFSKGTVCLGNDFKLSHDFEDYALLSAFMQASTTFQHHFTLGEKRVVEHACPKPFNTASLLQAASNRFSASAKDITSACQTLYQLGHITYMRTDSQKYSPVFVDVAVNYIKEKWSQRYVGDVSKVTVEEGSQDPHEAIRPTNLQMHTLVLNDAPELVARVYRMIWINTVQSCMAAEQVQCQTMTVTAPMNYVYNSALQLVLFDGYTAATAASEKPAAEHVSAINMLVKLSKTNEVKAGFINSVPFVKETRHYTEASLINKLDSLGIGRPSTFSMLTNVIQARNYVVRTNIEATPVMCTVYTYGQDGLVQNSVEKMFGQERNKLLITPLGSIVCEYLVREFESLFSYDYTNQMEQTLDAVAAGQQPWHTVCEKCLADVNALVRPLSKVFYALDDGHEFYFHTDKKTGKVEPLIRKANADGYIYKNVKPDVQIDFTRLKQGGYTVADLAVLPDGAQVIGKHGDKDIVVKSGKYGIYAECGETRVPMTSLSMPLEDVIKALEKKENKEPTLLRELCPELSIRNGPHGHYIYFMTKKMKKPKFFDVSGFGQDYLTCDAQTLIDWIVGKYKAKLSA